MQHIITFGVIFSVFITVHIVQEFVLHRKEHVVNHHIIAVITIVTHPAFVESTKEFMLHIFVAIITKH